MRLFLNTVYLILAISTGYSQVGSTIIESNEIEVGQQIMLTYHFTLEDNSKVVYAPFQKALPVQRNLKPGEKQSTEKSELEIAAPFLDTILIVAGKKEWFGTYTITGWEEGSFIISHTSLLLNGKKIDFPSAIVNVKLVKEIKGKDIYDIRESFAKIPDAPFSIKQFHSDNWWWIYPLLALIIGFFIYKKVKKAKLVKTDSVKIELSLMKKTILAIEQLDQRKLWSTGNLKEHYVELSFIFRTYLSKRFEINLLEKTTYEAKLLLTQKGLSKNTIETIGEILDQSDMVKFAKSSPEEIIALRLSQIAKEIIEQTSPKEVENVY